MIKYDKERHTEPVGNIIGHGNEEFMLRMSGFPKGVEHGVYGKVRRMGLKLVQAHKKLFGKQTYCWTGTEFRYWVWDYGSWRVWVSNGKGISIEVEPNMSADETMKILRNYWDKFEV